MPRHCSAGGCKSRDNRDTRNAGITFHKLPKRAPRRRLWISNSHRASSWDPQTDFVYFCSKHFTPDSFELAGCSGIRRLKEDAFPTVFESTSLNRCTSIEMAHKHDTQDNRPVRKDLCSADCVNTTEDSGSCQTSAVSSCQMVESAAEDADRTSPEPSGVASQVEKSPADSPWRYMRRLPPPPGFYLPKEHSYAQLCPLLWRRRYDQAVDCLAKALRQLHAARRRETRLRSTVLRLRDKRLKHTLHLDQDGTKNKGRWSPGLSRHNRGHEGDGDDQLDGDMSAASEDMMEASFNVRENNSYSERDKEFCFYCGRGQLQGGTGGSCRRSVAAKEIQATVKKDGLKMRAGVKKNTGGFGEDGKHKQMVRLERSPWKSPEMSASHVKASQISPPDEDVQIVDAEQELYVPDRCEGTTEGMVVEHQQELLWVQNGTEHILLVPVFAEDAVQSLLQTEEVTEEAQSILVSELDLKRELLHMMENHDVSRGRRMKTTCDDEPGDQQTGVHRTSADVREDVREKLKEHLEGFHLQLSTEFSVF